MSILDAHPIPWKVVKNVVEDYGGVGAESDCFCEFQLMDANGKLVPIYNEEVLEFVARATESIDARRNLDDKTR